MKYIMKHFQRIKMNRLQLYEDYQSDLAHECNDCQHAEILLDECKGHMEEIIKFCYGLSKFDSEHIDYHLSSLGWLLKIEPNIRKLLADKLSIEQK